MKIYFPRHQAPFLARANVGSHPQFRHLEVPPAGYEFETRRIGFFEWLARAPHALREFRAQLKIWREVCSSFGIGRRQMWRFLRDRGLSRLVSSPVECAASFLPTYPFTLQNELWFLEIEDITTIFYPYAINGHTADIKMRDLTVFPLVKKLLESKTCAGILTHVQSTKESVHRMFESDVIDQKTFHLAAPYLPPAPLQEGDLQRERRTDEIQFFFNNSWHQDRTNFYLRGGLSILESFADLLKQDYPVRLIIRSAIPRDLPAELKQLLKHPRVTHIRGFLSFEDYLRLLRSSHYFLLPSARLHVVSIMEAMYHGTVPITSDGWGIGEYVANQVTGHILPGVLGRVSWVDPLTGELRENYAPMLTSPGILTKPLKDLIPRLLQNPSRHAQMSLAAHRAIAQRHNVDLFNVKFKQILDDGIEPKLAESDLSRH